MTVKLRDLVNLTSNRRTHQKSLNIRKTDLKKFGLDIEDILNTPLQKKIKKFEKGDN